jgi:hypothetical protein
VTPVAVAVDRLASNAGDGPVPNGFRPIRLQVQGYAPLAGENGGIYLASPCPSTRGVAHGMTASRSGGYSWSSDSLADQVPFVLACLA